MDLYFTVASSSMFPVLNPGDKITIEQIGHDEIVVGQVVVFKSISGKMVVHRVIEKNGFVIVTAGDSNWKFDAPSHVYDIAGVVNDLVIKKPMSKWLRTVRAIKRRICNHP